MSDDVTFNALIRFLDYTAEKGLMKKATVSSRRATVNKVFEALDAEDRSNVTAIDIDDAMARFVNKSGSNYAPGSLQTYKSRLIATLEDFQAYRENPMGFRPNISSRTRRPKSGSEEESSLSNNDHKSTSNTSAITQHSVVASSEILPIPLRSDLVVRIQGLPHDLTTAEATKIGRVVQAYVVEE